MSLPLRSQLSALYSLAGQEAGIHAILKDFYRRMADDILIGFFFDGKNLDQIAAKQAEFLLRAMGATPSYQGLPPAKAHDNLAPILDGHFDRRLRLLEETLRAHKLSEDAIQMWVRFESTFRDSIVHK